MLANNSVAPARPAQHAMLKTTNNVPINLPAAKYLNAAKMSGCKYKQRLLWQIYTYSSCNIKLKPIPGKCNFLTGVHKFCQPICAKVRSYKSASVITIKNYGSSRNTDQ